MLWAYNSSDVAGKKSRCYGMFNHHFIANSMLSEPVKVEVVPYSVINELIRSGADRSL